MPGLVGGSLLLIGLAAVALVIGWIAVEPSLIWASILFSVAAAVLLALGYSRARGQIERAVRASPATAPPVEPAAEPMAEPTGAGAQTPAGAGATRPGGTAEAPAHGVVAVPGGTRYHRADCRFARSTEAESMTVAAARARGYTGCSICKPEAGREGDV